MRIAFHSFLWLSKKAEHRRTDAFELWYWRRLLGVPWTAGRSNQFILKKLSPGCSLKGMMLKLKLQYFGYLMWRVDSLEKDSDAGRDWGQEEKGTTEDEMAGWHHRLDGRECEWTPGVGDGQGGLVCCDSWGHKESDTTEHLNWTQKKITHTNFLKMTVFLIALAYFKLSLYKWSLKEIYFHFKTLFKKYILIWN